MDRDLAASIALFALLAGFPCSASGQNALGDGRALDANLSRDGRRNERVKDVAAQIRFNQRIIEGQAGDGRSFRGDLGYRATDEFGDSLGSSSLYTFRRDSASGSTAALPGLRTSDALRYQFGLTGGGGARSAGLPSSASELYISRLGAVSTGSLVRAATGPTAATQSGLITSLRSLAQYQAVSALMPTVLGYTGTEQSGRVAVTASPLRGLAYTVASPPPASADPARADRSVEYFGSGLSGMERRAFGVQGDQDAGPSGLQTPIDTSASPQRLSPDGTPYSEVVAALSRAIDQRFNPPRPAGEGAAQPPAPAAPADPNAPDTRPEWMKTLDRLRDELQGRVPRSPIPAPNPAPGTPAPAPAKEGPDERPADGPERVPGASDATRLLDGRTDEARDKFIESLRAMRARIDTLSAPESSTESYAKSMADAQARLAAGDYFAAEGGFSMALIAKPRDPMARVGRVHAQIGAGLFISAAGGLRDLFAQHPEMAPTVYAPALLPAPARCEALIERIKRDLADTGSGLSSDGALLMAYLGRQLDRPAWLGDGLREYDARTPENDAPARALGALLRRIWAEQPASDSPAK
ncbi:MAG: hypothetical protein AB7K52_01690 [Phycisphaerales bacterium]